MLKHVTPHPLLNLPGMHRMLFPVLFVLLLPGCLQVRTTSTVEPASREYKLLLDPARFDRPGVTESINALDRLVADAAHRSGVAYEGSLQESIKTRQVAFLDVPGKCTLRQNGLVLRLRSKGRKTTATLKYRTPRLSAITAASNPLQEVAKGNVEVDLKPPHDSIYSQSLSAKTGAGGLETLGDLYTFFPVTETLREVPGTRLAVVGKTPIHEEVRGKASLDLGTRSSLSLSLWYRTEGDTRPMIAELSFKYTTGTNSAADEARARMLFEELQQFEGWLLPSAMTKTAFVYASSPGFCEQE